MKAYKVQYAKDMDEQKNGTTKVKDSMEEVLGWREKASFQMRTGEVLGMYVCCRFLRAYDYGCYDDDEEEEFFFWYFVFVAF